MKRYLKAKNTGVNWYTEKTITVMDKEYEILEVEYEAIIDIWHLLVKAV